MRRFTQIVRVGAVLGALMSTSACISVGGHSRPSAPVVRDPAPVVAGTMRPYTINGRTYRPAEDADYNETGQASWYGGQHHGRRTASGEVFDMNTLTAAHRTLPLPSLVEVTNTRTGQSAIVRVNDRGPFSNGRIIDLSRAAADAIGMRAQGVAEVRVRYVGPAPRQGGGAVLADRPPSCPARPRNRDVAEGGPYWVQAGSFAERDNARRAAERLGAHASVDSARTGGRTLYRVLVGPWPDANSAEQARQDVVEHGFRDALLISGR